MEKDKEKKERLLEIVHTLERSVQLCEKVSNSGRKGNSRCNVDLEEWFREKLGFVRGLIDSNVTKQESC